MHGELRSALGWPARLGLLLFLWAVQAAIVWFAVRNVLPHVVGGPGPGWVLGFFVGTVLVSLLLAAVRMTGRVLGGHYPADTDLD
jgi:hypothetical protein